MSVQEAAQFYAKNLEDKKFAIEIQRGNAERTMIIRFASENFRHLMGLHKLKDIPPLKKRADIVYHSIFTGEITQQTLDSSGYKDEVVDRWEYYEELLNLLNTSSLYFKSLQGFFKKIEAEFVIARKIEQTNDKSSFLFFKEDPTNPGLYVPCSFFIRDGGTKYILPATHWKIISVREITNN